MKYSFYRLARVRIVRHYGDQHLALVDELVQKTFLRLCQDDCKVLRQCEQQHESTIFGFVRVVAASAATDHFRAQNVQKRPGNTPLTPRYLILCRRKNRATIQDGVLEQVEVCLKPRDGEQEEQSPFWLHCRQGFTAIEIVSISPACYSPRRWWEGAFYAW